MVHLIFIPLVVTATLVGKNAAEHGLWAPSSGAGQNIIQNLNMALVNPAGHGAVSLGRQLGYPAWWVWCYKEAGRRGNHPTKNVAGFYGMCISDSKGRDFRSLASFLREIGDARMLRVVTSDMEIQRERPWLWSGQVPERVTRTSIEYGKISQRLFFDVLWHVPKNFLGRAYDNLRTHFIGIGARFLVFHARSTIREPTPITWLNAIGLPLFYVGFFSALVNAIVVPLRMATGHFERGTARGPNSKSIIRLELAVCVLTGATLSAMLACCENYRHAFSFFPILMILSVIALTDTLALVRAIRLRRPHN